MADLTHFDADGAAHMVDVSGKDVTTRIATAEGYVIASESTIRHIWDGTASSKGDVLQIARLAGIMATKRTADLIPLCHTLPLEKASVDFTVATDTSIKITAVVRVSAKTGVEMEALTGVTVAALTIYDMCKAIDRGMSISNVQLVAKSGGRSGNFCRDSAD